VIHNYRWRFGLAEGEPKYDDLEKRLAEGPVITVPTITLEGDANGAPHPEASSYAKKFSGKYSHRIIEGGVGHNLPQEAPAGLCPSRGRRRGLLISAFGHYEHLTIDIPAFSVVRTTRTAIESDMLIAALGSAGL